MTSGFEQGSDFIQKRLSFEVPVEGLQNLREMNQELERFRVNAEAAARGGESFEGYVRQLGMTEERALQATRSLTEALERMVAASERASGQATYSTAIPPGYTAPFQAESVGMGGGDRGRLPTTVPDPWQELAQRDPRAYLNSRRSWGADSPQDMPTVSIDSSSLDQMAQRISHHDQENARQERQRVPHRAASRSRPGRAPDAPEPWENWRNRAEQWAGTAGRLMGGLGPGGSFSNVFAQVGRGLEGWGRNRGRSSVPGGPGGSAPDVPGEGSFGGEAAEGASGAEGAAAAGAEGAGGAGAGGGGALGALGGLLRFAGPVGALIGGFGAVEGLIQHGGQQIQQYRNLGMIRGGAAGQGFGYEMQARMMALNPFITNEQSRQIIQSALTQGYTGKEFDTVTAFMTNNLTQMNMSVAESTKLLQAAISNSNDSIKSITGSLTHAQAAMKAMSATGYNTLPERQASFTQSYQTLVDQGVDPSEAARMAGQATNAYSNMPGMSGVGGDVLRASMTSMPFEILMAQQMGIPASQMGDPDRLPDIMAKQGSAATSRGRWAVIKQMAGWSHGNLTVFRRMLQRFGINWTVGKARRVLDHADEIGTGSQNDPERKEREEQEREDKQQITSRYQADLPGGGFGGSIPGAQDPFSGGHSRVIPRGGGSGSITDKIIGVYGDEAEVGDPKDPDSWTEYDPTDADQRKGLISGKLRIRGPGDDGKGKKLSELPRGKGDSDDDGDHTGAGSGKGRDKPSGNKVHGNVTITVQPASMRQLLKIPQYVPLTANEQQANAGYGTAQKNDPPPGDTVTTRGAR